MRMRRRTELFLGNPEKNQTILITAQRRWLVDRTVYTIVLTEGEQRQIDGSWGDLTVVTTCYIQPGKHYAAVETERTFVPNDGAIGRALGRHSADAELLEPKLLDRIELALTHWEEEDIAHEPAE